ncbi:type II RES/Xre toxin-antitoxin system antitoxin [Oceanithermus sp.]
MTISMSERAIQAVKQGLPYSEFEELRVRLGVSAAALAAVVGVSERTLARRKKEGRFKPDESDRLHRIVRLYRRTVEVIGEDAAAQWLTTPKRFLSGKSPLEFADTEIGAYEIDQALGRLEHGVFA